MLQFSPIWLVEASSSWFLYPCGRTPSFFKCFLLFWHKMLQAYFLISCPGFIVRHFAKEPSLLLRKLAFRKEDLGPGCVQCFWGIAVSRTSQWDRSREYIYLYTHDPTIISISISISTSISIEKQEFTPVPVISTQHHRVHTSFLPFHICTLDNEKPGFHILNIFIFLLVWSIPYTQLISLLHLHCSSA